MFELTNGERRNERSENNSSTQRLVRRLLACVVTRLRIHGCRLEEFRSLMVQV
jgi:hypothetical protein